MSDKRLRCGNCGTINEVGAQFCMSCGVLLAAYQSPVGALPTDDQSPSTEMAEQATEPIAGPTEPQADDEAAAPPPPPESPPSSVPPTKPPADDGDESSVDDVFGSLPDVAEAAQQRTVGEESRDETDENDLMTGQSPEETAETSQALSEPPTEEESSASREGALAPTSAAEKPIAQAPVDVEGTAHGEPGRAGAAPRPRPGVDPPPSRWIPPAEPRNAFGTTGQRLSTTPPQTLIVIGVALISMSCVLGPIATAIDLPFIFEGPAWCAFPVGVIVLAIGLIQLAARRPNRL